MDSGGWSTAIVAVAGLTGTIVAGAIGYQSGANAVDKDYVQMAVANLDRKDASPELRKWSVDVLGKLSPVPFGKKLENELTAGPIYRERTTWKRIEPPAELMTSCPDLLKGKGPISQKLVKKVLVEYQVCRIKSESMLSWIAEINKIYDEANADQAKIDADFNKSVGIGKK